MAGLLNLKKKSKGKHMARFDLESYATVAERLAQFHKDYPDGRIVTKWENSYDNFTGARTWVVKATIYLDAGDQANKLAKGTGYASETDGTGGANNVAALPNAESSAIGRALMVIGYAMNKDPKTLASREEMQKVQRVAQPATDWITEAQGILNVDDLRSLYTRAKAQGAPADVLEQLKDYANALNTSSEDSGNNRSVPRSPAKR
jgi:hypothetical protein